MMLGNGLVNILLPVRMAFEEFSTDSIGFVLSLYFVGMLAGGIYSKNLIERAGHIRMFAGCMAIAAVSILVCSLYTGAILWGLMRVLLGFCNACAFTAIESWLSEISTKENRGKILAFYQAVVLAALFFGQFLLNISSIQGTVLFVISGILFSAAIVPVVLSRNNGPALVEVESVSLLTLLKKSPLGVVSCLTSGIIYSSAFNMLPVFAGNYGISGYNLSLFMGAAILGAFVLQFPVGYLSDRFDRRLVLLILLVVSTTSGFSLSILAGLNLFWPLSVVTGLSAGIISCTYPISISQVFDRLRQSEMVGAMGSLILIFSVGGILGPYLTSLVMNYFGDASLFWFLGAIQLLLAGFVTYRMRVSEGLPADEQDQFVMQGAGVASMVELDPRTEYVESEQPLSQEAELAVEIADSDPGAAVSMTRAVALSESEQGAEIAGAVAGVDGIDVIRFYKVMLESVPDQILPITSAMVSAKPELAYQMVSYLAQIMPDRVVEIATEISNTNPELRLDMARVAVEAAPETALDVAGYYAQELAEEYDSVRPADREDDTSEQDAVDLVSQISDLVPEQALEVAVTVVEAIPDTAEMVATDYAETLSEYRNDEFIEEMIETMDHINTAEEASDELNNDAIEFATRLSEVAPEYSMNIAGAIVDALPELANDIIDEFSEGEESVEHELSVSIDDKPAD